MHDRWGTVSDGILKVFHDQHESKAKSLSEGMISKFENSAKCMSMDIYKETLAWTLHWLREDRELEAFVDGILGLCESNALATHNNGNTRRTIRDVLTVLPGPTSFHASLLWSIIQLAQTRACLKALYYIPGAIRDVLAPYAVGEHHSLEILPLLNSTESLEIIDKLWDTHNDDVALSVQCATAVVASFMINPSHCTLDGFVTGDVSLIWDGNTSKQFLAKRLRVGTHMDGSVVPEYHPHSDSAHLQNIVRFLADIKDMLIDLQGALEALKGTLWSYGRVRTSHGKFDQQLEGNWALPAFVPAAQQDLIALTLEILAWDPIMGAATLQREAFCVAYEEFKKVVFTQAKEQAKEQRLGQPLAQTWVLSESDQEALAWIEMQAGDSIEMVKRALGSVMQNLGLQIEDTPTPYRHPPSIILPSQVVSTVYPDHVPVLVHVRFAQKLSPPLIEAIPSLSYSASLSSALPEAGDHSPM
ncbi:hypothetical protein EDB85DRAFT_2174727 [Lactarius pseudohatsudake]|nr:hypothetical protein EDB85DRAFT_2174727 [Lactarius pseudohatsudake]